MQYLCSADSLSLTHSHSYTHKRKALHSANKTLQTTTQLSDVCVPMSPLDTAPLWFGVVVGVRGRGEFSVSR